MDHILQVIHNSHDQILVFLKSALGAGILDIILRKIPTQKPLTILSVVRKILGFIADVCQTVDEVIDAVPGMSQNIKDPSSK
jgi:hypothetical protein